MIQTFPSHQPSPKPTPHPQLHSCPFCRCRSLDHSINMYPSFHFRKLLPKTCNFNFKIDKDLLATTSKFAKTQSQNVYYRTFQSPGFKSGLSPNPNKKIVIQYLSPQANKFNMSFRPFAKAQDRIDLKATFVISSPLKKSPRNIYTNQNTPPKAKFLQKMSSRKNSHQKMHYTTPVHQLTFSDNKKTKKPLLQQENLSPISLVIPVKQLKKRQSQAISIKASLDFYPKVPETETKNVIKRASGQDSIVQSSAREAACPSTSSTPINTTYLELTKNDIGPSIKEMVQANKEGQRQMNEILKTIKNCQIKHGQKKGDNSPRSAKMSPGRSSYSHERFDKTLGKAKTIQPYQENELMYSESERQTVNHPTNSERNIAENPLYKNQFQETLSKSQQNIRPLSEQQIQSVQNKQDSLDISDNFSTPKSKYKNTNQDKKNKVSGVIKFYPLGDNKKAKGAKASAQASEKSSIRTESRKFLQLSNVVKIETEQVLNSKEEIKNKYTPTHTPTPTSVQTKSTRPQHTRTQTGNFSHEFEISETSNFYGAELAEELDLNYDYYFYEPVVSPSLYQKNLKDFAKTDEEHDVKESSMEESMSVDVTF